MLSILSGGPVVLSPFMKGPSLKVWGLEDLWHAYYYYANLITLGKVFFLLLHLTVFPTGVHFSRCLYMWLNLFPFCFCTTYQGWFFFSGRLMVRVHENLSPIQNGLAMTLHLCTSFVGRTTLLRQMLLVDILYLPNSVKLPWTESYT